MNIKKVIFLIILIITVFTSCEDKNEITQTVLAPSSDTNRELPTFNLTTTKGETITIEVTKDGWVFKEYKNKAILLNFFATWCPPCKAEIPHLNELQKKYGDEFQVLSILVERDKPNSYVNKFIKKFNINYPITNSKVNFQLADAVGGVTSIPWMFLFNKEGVVVQSYVGAVASEILASDIKKTLGK